MFKKAALILLFFCFALHSNATVFVFQIDSLVPVLKLNDYNLQERRLTKYIQDCFGVIPIDSLESDKNKVDKYLVNYNVKNWQAYKLYIESTYQNRLLNIVEAEKDLAQATEIAAKARDHFLLYTFLSHTAFIQTYNGNAIGAIANFGAAKKEAELLNDPYLEVIIDVNISDIYYRYNFYSQSLDYLAQAQSIMAVKHINQSRLVNIIYYNKCENYFRMDAIDSLKKYSFSLSNSISKTNKLYTYIKRTQYYINLLNHDYDIAIKIMTALPRDTLYKYENIDKQNLADTWFKIGKLDSATQIIKTLLADNALNNHPEIKYHLYEVLGGIAEKQNNPLQAAYNFKMALSESKANIAKLVEVGDISSRLKVDEMEDSYIKQDQEYKTERELLLVILVFSVLVIAVVAMFYRNIRQKRHYEKLLFAAKKEELAYINSHEIRRHLTNILGIIDVLKHSEDKEVEYSNVEHHLFYSAEQLDEAIKNISQKLDEDTIE